MSTQADPRHASRADLDDDFVARAVFTEPSAAERTRPFPVLPPPPPRLDVRRRWYRRPVPLVLLVALALALVAAAWRPWDVPTGPPDHLVLIIAVPDGADVHPDFVDAVAHEAELSTLWLETQTGRAVRGDLSSPRVVTLSMTAEELRGGTVRAYERIMADLDLRDDAFGVVVSPLRTETTWSGQQTCGRGGRAGVVLFLGNCNHTPSTTSAWGSPLSRTITHEILHGMGAVADCAPHGTSDGHVDDDRADVMYQGADRVDPATTPLALDAGRDDYYGHNNIGCPDIVQSPLWVD